MNGHTIREVATAATVRQPEQSTGTLKIFSNSAMNANKLRGRLYGFKIFEEGELVHDYAPICQGGTYALVDKVTGDVKTSSVSGSSPFVYGGGMGYGKFAGEKTALTTNPADTTIGPNKIATLTAFAPGAVRYIWTRNGSVLSGADSSELEVAWEKPKTSGTPIYGVTPVFLKDGVEVRGAAANGGAIAAVATRARLGSGVHTIRISNATAWTPDIDRMTVVLALADSASCGK